MKKALSILLTACCGVIGYGFYKINHEDVLTGFFLAFGLTGIVLSILRQKSAPVSPESSSDPEIR